MGDKIICTECGKEIPEGQQVPFTIYNMIDYDLCLGCYDELEKKRDV